MLRKKSGKMDVDKKTTIDVKCQVRKISFSAHADAKGILEMVYQVSPKILFLFTEKNKK